MSDPGAGVFREQNGVHTPLAQEERGRGALEGPAAMHVACRQARFNVFMFAFVSWILHRRRYIPREFVFFVFFVGVLVYRCNFCLNTGFDL